MPSRPTVQAFVQRSPRRQISNRVRSRAFLILRSNESVASSGTIPFAGSEIDTFSHSTSLCRTDADRQKANDTISRRILTISRNCHQHESSGSAPEGRWVVRYDRESPQRDRHDPSGPPANNAVHAIGVLASTDRSARVGSTPG